MGCASRDTNEPFQQYGHNIWLIFEKAGFLQVALSVLRISEMQLKSNKNSSKRRKASAGVKKAGNTVGRI